MTIAIPHAADQAYGTLSKDLQSFARKAAASSDPVLLLGETGSGKTHLARLIHRLSPRSAGPLVCISLGSIAETLFERELFGHVRGAYTDAKDGAAGLIEAANGGTLILDEIGELPLSLQAKLLGVLEDGRVRRLGSTREIEVDVRVIAATNADLEAMVAERRFRADLYFRMEVLTLRIPPLRERVEQIPVIGRGLLERLASGGKPARLSDAAIAALQAYPWPGNIRELESALRWAATFCDRDVIEVRDLPIKITEHSTGRAVPDERKARRYVAPDEPERERAMILRALREEAGNRTMAARRLGMSRATLYTKLLRFGIDAGDHRGEGHGRDI